MKAAECLSLSIKIGGVQNLLNEVLINPYKLGYKSSHLKKLSLPENLSIKRHKYLEVPGPRLYIWWVAASKVLVVLLTNSVNHFASKNPPGAIISGFGSIPL